jgi:DDB1- and CUL4-associated factor 13
MSNGALPLPSAVQEKLHRHSHSSSWTKPILLPIPGVRTRRLRILVPYSGRLHQFGVSRLGRKRVPLVVCFACLTVVLIVFFFSKRMDGPSWGEESTTASEPSTLVFRREDLQRIWNWEISSGHYPSRRSGRKLHGLWYLRFSFLLDPVPKQIGLKTSPLNPAIPSQPRTIIPSRYRPPPTVLTTDEDTDTRGVGPKRVYLDIQSLPPSVSYPPRPVPGSVADLDVVMKHCDFSEGKVDLCTSLVICNAGLIKVTTVRP